MVNKLLVINIIGVILLIAGVGNFVFSYDFGNSEYKPIAVYTDGTDTSNLKCSEFLTNAVNGSYVSGTWAGFDIDDDDELELYKYRSRDLVSSCGASSRDRLLGQTDEGYSVYTSGTGLFICIPSLYGDFIQIKYSGTYRDLKFTCMRCDPGESICVGHAPSVCEGNKFVPLPKEIGICGVECLSDEPCRPYRCIDSVCSTTEIIEDVESLNEILDRYAKEINELRLTISDKVNMIDLLNLNIENKANLIDQLNLTIQEKSQLISQLNLELEEKEDLINYLNSTISEKIVLISSLGLQIDQLKIQLDDKNLELEEKANIINNLQLTINQKASLISSLNLELEEKANIINNLNLDLDEKSKLINSLELSLSEKEIIIGELNNQISAKIRMIEELKKKQNLRVLGISGGLLLAGVILLFINSNKDRRKIVGL